MQEVLRPLLTREDGEVIALLSMQLYVVTALEQLERDAGKFTRAARQIKESAGEALNKWRVGELGSLPLSGTKAHMVLEPILLACRSGRANLAETALSALHKLIAHACLEEGVDVGPVSEAAAMAADISRPSVQLAVIRALVGSATSQEVKIQGQSLLYAMRCLCSLAILGSSEQIQSTARGAAFQVADFVVQRYFGHVAQKRISSGPSQSGISFPDQGKLSSMAEHADVAGLEEALRDDNEDAEMDVAGGDEAPADGEDSGTKQEGDEHEEQPPPTLEIKPVRRESKEGANKGPVEKGARVGMKEVQRPGASQEEIDAKLILRALCKLSFPGAGKNDDETNAKTRAMALDLLRQLFQRKHLVLSLSALTQSLRKPLTLALVRNGTSAHMSAFHLSAQILSLVMLVARREFKVEISVLYPILILQPLERAGPKNADNSNTPILQGSLQRSATAAFSSLNAVKSLWSEPQVVADMFANYDCDMWAPDLYSRTVSALATLQGHSNHRIRVTCLDCLLTLLSSLHSWAMRGRTEEANKEKTEEKKEEEEDAKEEPETERYMAAKTQKKAMENAAAEFNDNPVKGMARLRQEGRVGESPEEQAEFLLATPGLDKEKLGEFLGHHEENEIMVMHKYMRQFTFTGEELDEALRRFLGSFRLPGEAQKIDRIMEAFASRYTECNPQGDFESADAAYIVSFAIVMLNTDAHNPALEGGRMSKEDFVQMATSSESSAHVPPGKLEGIYDRIISNELAVPGATNAQGESRSQGQMNAAVDFAMPWKRRTEREQNAQREAERLLDETKKLFEKTSNHPVFQAASEPGLTRLMLESAGEDLLRGLSHAFDQAETARAASHPLNGARNALRLAAYLRLGFLRARFVSFLASAPALDNPRAISARNGEALRVLLEVATREAIPLGDAWKAVLTAVSQLQQLRLLGTSEANATPFIPKHAPQTSAVVELKGMLGTGTKEAERRQGKSQRVSSGSPVLDTIAPGLVELQHTPGHLQLPPEVLEHIGGWLQQTGDDIVDRVFARTVALDNEEVVGFARSLAAVARAELWPASSSESQLFSLYRLVEMAQNNIGRVRMVWNRIWEIASELLIGAASHPSEHVAVCSVDALRQVSTSVLRRSVFGGAGVEPEAFKPFASILRSSTQDAARELAVQSVGHMLASFGSAVGQGHKTALMVLTSAADDPYGPVAASALATVEPIVPEMAERLPKECYADAVNALAAFATGTTHPELSGRALEAMRQAAGALAEAVRGDDGSEEGSTMAEFTWAPLLTAFADATFDAREEVADKAMRHLFLALSEYGGTLSKDLWDRTATSAIFSLLDPARAETTPDDTEHWMASRAANVFPKLGELLSKHESACDALFCSACSKAFNLTCSDHRELSHQGVWALYLLARGLSSAQGQDGSDSAKATEWMHLCRCITSAAQRHAALDRWDLHLAVVTCAGMIFSGHGRIMSGQSAGGFLDLLLSVREEAASLNNAQAKEEDAFGREGAPSPSRARTELEATERVLQGLQARRECSEEDEATSRALGQLCEGVIREAAEIEGLGRAKGRQVRMMRAPVVAKAVDIFGELPRAEFIARLQRVYPDLARLVSSDQHPVCHAVSSLFDSRLHQLLSFNDES